MLAFRGVIGKLVKDVIHNNTFLMKSNYKVTYLLCNQLHQSCQHYGLMEFFDHKEHWGQREITVGRPWKCEELRLKSNTDLHKLWYVLLKERNMLMTMEEEYNREVVEFPAPDRIYKVEESMENILEVVRERDRAYNLLETGETGEPGKRWVYNVLGLGYWRNNTEHFMPMHENPSWKASSDLPSTDRFEWTIPYKRLYREKKQATKNYERMMKSRERKKLDKMYPDSDLE